MGNTIAHEPPIEYPSPPNLVAAVRAYSGPEDTATTSLTAYRFPICQKQALEAIARDADRPKQHTVAALLHRGLPRLHRLPGVAECREARQELLRGSHDQRVHLLLEQTVSIDILTGGLGHTRFPVRVGIAHHRLIGLLAKALGLSLGQCFTLTLTAAMLGSPYVPMDSAYEAMHRTIVELLERCKARARHMDTLLSEMRSTTAPEPTTPRRTIDDLLAGHPDW